MFIIKMVRGVYNFFKNIINNCYHSIVNFPNFYKAKINSAIIYFHDSKYKLSNLSQTNMELGLYHLKQMNLTDAIIRFRFVDAVLDKNSEIANYWLGWCYFLKNNNKKAIYFLDRAGSADRMNLKNFIERNSIYEDIPEEILQQYRDLTVINYAKNFHNEATELPRLFIQKTLNCIENLPEIYNILELGSGIGFAGYEIHKRFPDHFKLTGVEISKKMIDLSATYYSDLKIYNNLIRNSVQEALITLPINFDIILSLGGLSSTRNLSSSFERIFAKLNENGYFAFTLRIGQSNIFCMESKEFIFNNADIKNKIVKTGFQLLKIEEIKLTSQKLYNVFICKKIT